METKPRPFGVAFLSVVLMIGGVLDIIGSGLLLLEREDASVLDRMGGSSDEIAIYAITGMLIGIVVIAVAVALRAGSNFARYFIAFLAVIRLLGLAWAVATFAKGDWYDALVPAVVYALVAGYLLFDKDSQAFFEPPVAKADGAA
jgi:hypothetical protein